MRRVGERASMVLGFVAAVALGICLDRVFFWRDKSQSEAQTSDSSNAPSQSTAKSKAFSRSQKKDEKKLRSLDEVAAAIQGLANQTLGRRSTAIDEIVDSVLPDDLPAVLPLAEQTSPEEFRAKFREALLGRWAKSDPEAAMAYAEKVANAQKRTQAIVAVLGPWAETDSAGAIAWATHIVPGPLR